MLLCLRHQPPARLAQPEQPLAQIGQRAAGIDLGPQQFGHPLAGLPALQHQQRQQRRILARQRSPGRVAGVVPGRRTKQPQAQPGAGFRWRGWGHVTLR